VVVEMVAGGSYHPSRERRRALFLKLLERWCYAVVSGRAVRYIRRYLRFGLFGPWTKSAILPFSCGRYEADYAAMNVIPEILELLKRHGPTEKNLVYNDEEVTRAFTILKWRKLAINATRGFWCPTSEGSKHPRITPGQARELTTLRVLIAKEKARKP